MTDPAATDLRDALLVIAKHTDDERLRDLVDDVLDGSINLRDAVTSDHLDGLAPKAGEALEWWNDLPDAERDALVRQGEEELDRLRAEADDEGGEDWTVRTFR